MVLGPGLIVNDLKGALTSRPMLRGGDFHLAQPCIGVAQLRDSLLVAVDFVLIVGIVRLSASRRPWCLDVEEKQRYLRRVPVALSRRFCVVDNAGALVGVDFAWMSLFDTLNLFQQVGDLAAVFWQHQIVVLYVPTVEVVHVFVRFRSMMMQC